MSRKRVVFFVGLLVLLVVAALFTRPNPKPVGWTVVEVRYLKNGSCSFVAEWCGRVLSVPEYIKANRKTPGTNSARNLETL